MQTGRLIRDWKGGWGWGKVGRESEIIEGKYQGGESGRKD
jgi:hypothetical protein